MELESQDSRWSYYRRGYSYLARFRGHLHMTEASLASSACCWRIWGVWASLVITQNANYRCSCSPATCSHTQAGFPSTHWRKQELPIFLCLLEKPGQSGRKQKSYIVGLKQCIQNEFQEERDPSVWLGLQGRLSNGWLASLSFFFRCFRCSAFLLMCQRTHEYGRQSQPWLFFSAFLHFSG